MTASTPEPLTVAEVALVSEVVDGYGHGNQIDVANALTRLLAVAEDHARLVGVVAAVEAERDKYLAAFSEQFDQREEYATECKRLWKVEAAVEALADRWTRDGLTHGRLLRAALDTTATKEGS